MTAKLWDGYDCTVHALMTHPRIQNVSTESLTPQPETPRPWTPDPQPLNPPIPHPKTPTVEARKLEHSFRRISARIPYTLP